MPEPPLSDIEAKDIPAVDTAGAGLQRAAARAGEELRTALVGLLDQLAEGGVREQRAVQKTLNLSQPVTSRLMSAARLDDPLASLASMPGPEGLRKMLKGAAKAGVDPACLARVETAIAGVEAFLESEVGDRYTLDALLSEYVHESRASFELRQKCSAFKAMSAIRGVQARLILSSWIVHPSGNPNRHDLAGVSAVLGCRRVRPSAVFQVRHGDMTTTPHRFEPRTLDGNPIESGDDLLLPGHTSLEGAQVRHHRREQSLDTSVANLPLGTAKGTDLVFGRYHREVYRATREGLHPHTGASVEIEPPAEHVVLDMLVHDDVWTGIAPQVWIFDTAVRGIAHPDDADRQGDRLDMLENIVSLGRGLGRFRIAEVPKYTEMIEGACAKRGWDPNALRGYRVKVRYPVYGSQIVMAFHLADA